ncbi:hypothetical protein VSR69_38345 [Paraburkholderia phytofirmans]
MRHSHVAVLLALCLTSLAYGGDGRDPDNGQSGNRDDQAVLRVFDGQGRYVGPLVAFNGARVATVVVANRATIVVPLSRTTNPNDEFSASQYEWGSDLISTAYYPSADCSGPPFINGDSPVRPSVTLRVGATATVYIAPDTDSSTITVLSYGEPGSCTALGFGHDVQPPITAEGWAPESTYPLTQIYPEPLSVHY